MSEKINAVGIDLSHHDPADDYEAVRGSGIVGVIYKATQGTGYTDPTYVEQRHAARGAGLRWGSYHFAEATDVEAQAQNFVQFAAPGSDELFALDWEDNGSNTMSAAQAKEWITRVEGELKRPGECVIYSGNTAKELIEGSDSFFGSRRLWLAQYGSAPVPQESWANYWLWQFTDGEIGPAPHTVDGVGPCDINSYGGSPDQLRAEWAAGTPQPAPSPRPQAPDVVLVDLAVPEGVRLRITVNGLPYGRSHRAD